MTGGIVTDSLSAGWNLLIGIPLCIALFGAGKKRRK